eukprot:gene8328-14292_t
MCGADCWTDHRLIISKTKPLIQPSRRPQGQKIAKRLSVNKLKILSAQKEFSATMSQRLSAIAGNDWDSLKTISHSVALQKFLEEKPIRMTQTPPQRNMHTMTSAEKSRESSVPCKLHGSAIKLTKSKTMPIRMI